MNDDVSVIIYAGDVYDKERIFNVPSKYADALIELITGEGRFWEWEKEIKLLKIVKEQQIIRIKTLRQQFERQNIISKLTQKLDRKLLDYIKKQFAIKMGWIDE